MDNSLNSPWNNDTPFVDAPAQFLETEIERWDALQNDGLGLIRNPHRYGPLTYSGYIAARRHWRTGDDDKWPSDPVAIAHILVITGIEHQDAAIAAAEQLNQMSHYENKGFSEVVRVHLALLDRLGVESNYQELIKLVKEIKWGGNQTDDSTEFMDYMNCFETMKVYLPTVNDENEFLKAVLPEFPRSYNAFGKDGSLGMAIAAKFHRADPAPILKWCQYNDDPVGIAFLVWQKRATFNDLLMAAFINAPTEPLQRGYNADDADNIEGRKTELLETLEELIKKIPREELQEEGRAFYQQHRNVVDKLLRTELGQPGDDEWFKWAFTLHACGVMPKDEPFFTSTVDQCIEDIDSAIEGLESGMLRDNSFNHKKLSEQMHYTCGEEALRIGQHVRDYLVKDMIMRADKNDLYYPIKFMPDTTWIKGAPIGQVINARVKGKYRTASELIVPLYALMSREEQVDMAKILVAQCIDHQVPVPQSINSMCELDNETHKGFTSTHQGLARLMHFLTKEDPAPLMESMNSLDVKEGEPLFLQMTQDWVAKQMLGKQHDVTLPLNVGDDFLGL